MEFWKGKMRCVSINRDRVQKKERLLKRRGYLRRAIGGMIMGIRKELVERNDEEEKEMEGLMVGKIK